MVDIDEVQRQVDTWTQFRDVGSHMQDTQIKILEQELKDMQNSFDEMSSKWQDWVVCQAEPRLGAEWVKQDEYSRQDWFGGVDSHMYAWWCTDEDSGGRAQGHVEVLWWNAKWVAEQVFTVGSSKTSAGMGRWAGLDCLL